MAAIATRAAAIYGECAKGHRPAPPTDEREEPPMTDVNSQIRDRIESFVQELSELVRRAALESVSNALGSGIANRAAVRAAGRALPSAAAIGRARRGGGKRSAEELESMTSSVIDYINKNPGQGVEQIARELGVSSKELVLPIRKLVSTGKLSTEGQKRATKYFVGEKSGGTSSDGASRGRGRKGSRAQKKGRRGKA